jgi:hypothetical protein
VEKQDIERTIKLGSIFAPEATRRRLALHETKKRVVHYTSAENALKIITSQTMWLRNTNCMSDFSEVEFGFQMLRRAFSDQTRKNAFLDALDSCFARLGNDALNYFDQWWPELRTNTYICSVSEHEGGEDLHGRLSMWRAFGTNATARAAIVMNVPPLGVAEGLNVVLSPVEYDPYEKIEARLEQVIRNISANADFLRTFPREHLQSVAFSVLASAAVCVKHVGFEEEREWRIIHMPNFRPSELLTSSLEIVGGIPQVVYKVPLKEDSEHDVTGIGVPALVDHIIIGPSQYPLPMQRAFTEALRQAGMPEPEKRVVVSFIPIRC